MVRNTVQLSTAETAATDAASAALRATDATCAYVCKALTSMRYEMSVPRPSLSHLSLSVALRLHRRRPSALARGHPKGAHLAFFHFHLVYIFKVRGREPAVAHRTGCAASWPGSTCLCGGQPTLADLSSAQKRA